MNLAMYANVKNIGKVNELLEIAKGNETLVKLGEKLKNASASEAYTVLKDLDDHELRIIAAMIGEVNSRFSKK